MERSRDWKSVDGFVRWNRPTGGGRTPSRATESNYLEEQLAALEQVVQDGHAEAETRMKTLVRWAARLYPAAWRERYGGELEALLEDVGPGGGRFVGYRTRSIVHANDEFEFLEDPGELRACRRAGSRGLVVDAAASVRVDGGVRIRVAPPSAAGEIGFGKQMAAERHLQQILQVTLSRTSLSSIIPDRTSTPTSGRSFRWRTSLKGCEIGTYGSAQ